ncbi:MAG: helix-turn-helix transcriptional regulator [Oscillospiraceae bacterium]
MNQLTDESRFIEQIMTLLETQFGSKCEVVLHDLTKDYSQTIVDIRNGHVTQRSIGGCGSNLGLEVLSGNIIEGDRFNYVTHTQTGRILRSSSIYIKDDDGKVIGSLCVNYDITEMVQFEATLKNFNHYEMAQEEVFVQDVNGLLDFLIREGQNIIGKSIDHMSKEEKMEFIGFLDDKGAFLITRSSEKLCEILGISRFTFYNWLEAVRHKKAIK